MRHEIEVDSVSKVCVGTLADAISTKNSYVQAIILSEIFEAIKHTCKDRYNLQLSYIAQEINRHNFENLKESLESLCDFLKLE